MAIRANDGQIFQLCFDISIRLIEWVYVVNLAKSFSDFTINFFEIKTTDLTAQFTCSF